MSEFDSPTFVECVCDKKAEGKTRVLKYLLIFCYVAFVGLYFGICYYTRFIPLFAVCPIFTWMLIFFTWRFVSYDVYYTFEHGHMEFGKVKKRKRNLIRSMKLKIDVQNSVLTAPYKTALSLEEYKNVVKVRDFSPTLTSDKLVVIIYSVGAKNEAVIFETSAKLSRLLMKFSPVVKNPEEMPEL